MVLQKMYKNFSSVADNISDWRSLSKNELLNKYIEHEDNEYLRESYIAAIFCKYWGAINTYYRSSSNSVSIEDCFEWLTHAIMYALKHRKWKDPKNKLYNDPNGPDKVVNICIASTRKIFYQANNNDNRKINFGLESIERLQEDKLSYILPAEKNFENSLVDNLTYRELVTKCFSTNAVQSLVIDGILNGDVFDRDKKAEYIVFNKKKLAKHLRNLDTKYIKHISSMYNIEETKVSQTSTEIKNMLNTKLYKIIDFTLVSLHKTIDKTNEI